MRQVFIFLMFFISSFALADHDGTGGRSYNGRTFTCGGYEDSKRFAEELGGGGRYYNWALCQLHYGELRDGIDTLHRAADDMGDLHAAVVLAKYYISDNYKLSDGKITNNKRNLQKAIDYRKLALRIIRSQQNYPFDDPAGDAWRIEREDLVYLKTASGLAISYIGQFVVRINAHLNSKNTDIGNATIESLTNTIRAAKSCLTIRYNSKVWSRAVYNKYMAQCEENKRIAEELLPWERDRLLAASESCQNIKLSDCKEHETIKNEIVQLYNEHLSIADQLLASL